MVINNVGCDKMGYYPRYCPNNLFFVWRTDPDFVKSYPEDVIMTCPRCSSKKITVVSGVIRDIGHCLKCGYSWFL